MLLELEPELNIEEDKSYKAESIKHNAIYTKATKSQLPGFYYPLF